MTRHAQAAEVAQALRTSEELRACRALVEEAGCTLQPDWAGGAWLLVPLTREQLEEAGVRLSPIHVLALCRDEAAVKRALQAVPKTKRPKVKVDMLETADVQEGLGIAEESVRQQSAGSSRAGVPHSQEPTLQCACDLWDGDNPLGGAAFRR